MSIPLFLFTFNCAKLPQSDFSKLHDSLPTEIPELLVFGFQELVEILDSTIPKKVNEALYDINESLHQVLKSKYHNVPVSTVNMYHLGAIGIIIMTPFQSRINKIDNSFTSCGLFYSSLKGGIGARVSYKKSDDDDDNNGDDVEFTFINAHLSANEGYVERRNRDSWRILKSLEFKDGWSALKPGTHCFFMGDLNYRVAVYGDELKQQMIERKIFKGFQENEINFDPSYKFNLGNTTYNPKRAPSWCDRILYLKYPNENKDVKLIKYDKLSFQSSDHQPVILSIKVPSTPPIQIINSNGYLIEGGEYLKSSYSGKIGNSLMILSDAMISIGFKSILTTSGRIILIILLFLILWLLR